MGLGQQFSDHKDMAEFEIYSLLDISKKSEPHSDSLNNSTLLNHAAVATSTRVSGSPEPESEHLTKEVSITAITEVQSAEFFKVASRLGAFFGQNQSHERCLNDRLTELLGYAHRPWSVIFVHNRPHPCTIFKFDTKMPILFDNPPEPKLSVPPLPKSRAEMKKSFCMSCDFLPLHLEYAFDTCSFI